MVIFELIFQLWWAYFDSNPFNKLYLLTRLNSGQTAYKSLQNQSEL
jgi:hypothetical protein